MKYKKLSYILVLILMLIIGIDRTYAEQTKECFYYSDSNDLRIRIEMHSGYDNTTWKGLGSYVTAEINKIGVEPFDKQTTIDNWTSETSGGRLSICTSDSCFGHFSVKYQTLEEANNDTNPSCPKYVVLVRYFGWWNQMWRGGFREFRVLITDDLTQAQNAKTYLSSIENMYGNYAENRNITADEYYKGITTNNQTGTDIPKEEMCDELFGDPNDDGEENDVNNDGSASISYILNQIMGFIRIIVPILIIVLGLLDLGKAVVAGKEDDMKKAQITFIKRLIIGVCVFFVPVLVNLIMELADLVWEGLGYSSCDYNF